MAEFYGVGRGLENFGQLFQQAMQQAAEQKLRKEQLAQNEERIAIERQARADETDRWKKQHELEEKKLEADLASGKVNRQLLLQKVAENYQNFGIKPPGATDTPGPGPSMPSMPAIPALGMQATPQVSPPTNILSIPGVGEMEVATPEELTRRDVARNEALEAPKRTTQALLQNDETERMLKVEAARQATEHTNKLIELGKENDFKLQQIKEQKAADLARAQFEGGLRFRESMINATGGLSELPGNIFSQNKGQRGGSIQLTSGGTPEFSSANPIDPIHSDVRRLFNWDTSVEQLKKENPKMAAPTIEYAKSLGVTPPTQKQLDQRVDLEQVATMVPTLARMINTVANNPNASLMNPMSDAYKQYQADAEQIKKMTPAMERILTQTKRVPNANAMKAYEDALIPTRGVKLGPIDFTNTKQNILKYQEFVQKDLQDAFNTITAGMSDGQKAALKDKMGLNNLPYLKQVVGGTPGQNTSPGGMPTPQVPGVTKPGGSVNWVWQDGKLIPQTQGQ